MLWTLQSGMGGNICFVCVDNVLPLSVPAFVSLSVFPIYLFVFLLDCTFLYVLIFVLPLYKLSGLVLCLLFAGKS